MYVDDIFIPIETFLSTGYGGNLPKRPDSSDYQSSSEKCNTSIISFMKRKFRDNDEVDDNTNEEEDEEEEEEEDKNEEENEEEEKESNEDEDENESSNIEDSGSDGFFSLYDFQQIKADSFCGCCSQLYSELMGIYSFHKYEFA